MDPLLPSTPQMTFVVEFIKRWETKYVYSIEDTTTESETNSSYFKTTWSLPTKENPLPLSVAFIYFAIRGKEPDFRMEYRVEDECELHYGDEAIQFADTWIARILRRKLESKKFVDFRRPEYDESKLLSTKKEAAIEKIQATIRMFRARRHVRSLMEEQHKMMEEKRLKDEADVF